MHIVVETATTRTELNVQNSEGKWSRNTAERIDHSHHDPHLLPFADLLFSVVLCCQWPVCLTPFAHFYGRFFFKIWDKQSLECLKILTGHTGSVLCLQYDDRVIVTGSSDSTVRYRTHSQCTSVIFKMLRSKLSLSHKPVQRDHQVLTIKHVFLFLLCICCVSLVATDEKSKKKTHKEVDFFYP